MYWLYISICLSVKYIIYFLTEKFHFYLFQTMEFYAINLNLNNLFINYVPKILPDIIVWGLYGISPDLINYWDLLDNYKLIFSTISLLILFLFYIFKNILKNFYLKHKCRINNFGIIVLKFWFLSFLPFLSLAIRDISYLNTNSFINSFVALFIISVMCFALPAIIFNILYGKKRFKNRKKYYFLLDPFKKNFKFMSIVLLSQQILDAIGIALYNFYPIIINTYMLIIKIITLSLNLSLFKNAYENINQVNISEIFKICLLVINYGLILSNSEIFSIILNVIYVLIFLIYLVAIYKNSSIKLNKTDDDLELGKINSNIPGWAVEEYLGQFEDHQDFL